MYLNHDKQETGYDDVDSLTLTKVVFEFIGETLATVLQDCLTLTKVVFEFKIFIHWYIVSACLTLTKVVFEWLFLQL